VDILRGKLDIIGNNPQIWQIAQISIFQEKNLRIKRTFLLLPIKSI